MLHFARRAAETGEMPVEEILLTPTPWYLNFGLSRSFDPQYPFWQEFPTGYGCASYPVTWTHSLTGDWYNAQTCRVGLERLIWRRDA